MGEICIILDDVFSCSKRGYGVGVVSGKLEELASRERHYKIACILLSQRIYSISPSIRRLGKYINIINRDWPRVLIHKQTWFHI